MEAQYILMSERATLAFLTLYTIFSLTNKISKSKSACQELGLEVGAISSQAWRDGHRLFDECQNHQAGFSGLSQRVGIVRNGRLVARQPDD
ncbi:hypothetical protein PoB_007098200 [Plakobranchus ocellatus]|uniref:Uncharacterized protein n=1 Tax=Plakobranchus ocellatus TaxID=259542 RepID=A0AAV4DJM4_9GAST|nr:hypothetical protein PoB_007098200 [Plakobranchus ocellatus]